MDGRRFLNRSSRSRLTSPPEKRNLHMPGTRRQGISTRYKTRPCCSMVATARIRRCAFSRCRRASKDCTARASRARTLAMICKLLPTWWWTSRMRVSLWASSDIILAEMYGSLLVLALGNKRASSSENDNSGTLSRPVFCIRILTPQHFWACISIFLVFAGFEFQVVPSSISNRCDLRGRIPHNINLR